MTKLHDLQHVHLYSVQHGRLYDADSGSGERFHRFIKIFVKNTNQQPGTVAKQIGGTLSRFYFCEDLFRKLQSKEKAKDLALQQQYDGKFSFSVNDIFFSITKWTGSVWLSMLKLILCVPPDQRGQLKGCLISKPVLARSGPLSSPFQRQRIAPIHHRYGSGRRLLKRLSYRTFNFYLPNSSNAQNATLPPSMGKRDIGL